jgi:hypothetical protein
MAYEPIRKYGDKDKLPSGDPGKVIFGAELDEEFSGVASDLTSLDEFKTAQLESNKNAYDELVKHGLFIEAHEKRLDALDGGNEDDPTATFNNVHINGTLTSSSNTELGDSNDDQHVFHGDVYVGYTDPNNVPDTDLGDVTPGTLFVSRGVKLVQDPAASDGHIPSFNAGGFKVVNLAPGVNNEDSINFKQFNDFKEAQLGSNQNVYEYLVEMEMHLQASDDFAEFKRRMLESLKSSIEKMEP